MAARIETTNDIVLVIEQLDEATSPVEISTLARMATELRLQAINMPAQEMLDLQTLAHHDYLHTSEDIIPERTSRRLLGE